MSSGPGWFIVPRSRAVRIRCTPGSASGTGGVDGDEAGPRVRAAQDRRRAAGRPGDVVHEATVSAQQARIFVRRMRAPIVRVVRR